MIQVFVLSIILLGIALAGLALNILLKKNGRFPAYQVGHNKDMKKLGIACVKHEEIKCHKKLRSDPSLCTACNSILPPAH